MIKRCSTRLLAAAVLAVGLSTVVTSAQASGLCARDDTDLKTLNARVLQTELMVAALSCNERSRYNAFVVRYKPELATLGGDLKQLFSVSLGKQAKSSLNAFVTKLANQASQRQVTQGSAFCTRAAGLFDRLLGQPSSVAAVARDSELAGLHGVAPCGGSEQQAALPR